MTQDLNIWGEFMLRVNVLSFNLALKHCLKTKKTMPKHCLFLIFLKYKLSFSVKLKEIRDNWIINLFNIIYFLMNFSV